VTLPPNGGRTKAHIHENHESAFYLISGEDVEVWTGEQLEHRDVAHAGDYLYFPAGVLHMAVNRGETPAVFVVARTDPNEQESVVMRRSWTRRCPSSTKTRPLQRSVNIDKASRAKPASGRRRAAPIRFLPREAV
jgi:oxalate decarboxylase/phosphoglucose isomerase-like protein (cupin superfamily)